MGCANSTPVEGGPPQGNKVLPAGAASQPNKPVQITGWTPGASRKAAGGTTGSQHVGAGAPAMAAHTTTTIKPAPAAYTTTTITPTAPSPTAASALAAAAAATASRSPAAPAITLSHWQAILSRLRADGVLRTEPSQLPSTSAGDLPPVGISVRFLRVLAAAVGNTATTQEVLEQLVVPACQSSSSGPPDSGKVRFVDFLNPSHTGAPKFFVSHRRGAPFADLVNAVSDHMLLAAGAGQALLDRASGQRSSTPSDAGGSVMVWVDIFCSAAAVSVAAAGGPPPLTRALGGSIRLSSAGMTGPTGASAGGAAAPSKDVLAMQAVREVRKAVGLTDGTLLCLDGAGQVLSRLWVQWEVAETAASDRAGLGNTVLHLVGPTWAGPDLSTAALVEVLAASARGSGLSANGQYDVRALAGPVSNTLGLPLPPAYPTLVNLQAVPPAVASQLAAAVAEALKMGALQQSKATLDALAAWPQITSSTDVRLSSTTVPGGLFGSAATTSPGKGGTYAGGASLSATTGFGSVRMSPGGLTSPKKALGATVGSSSAAATALVQAAQAKAMADAWRIGADAAAEVCAALRAAASLARCGAVLHALGSWEAAEAPLRRALQLRGRAVGGEAAPTASSYVALGQLLYDMGDTSRAGPLLRKGIAHTKRVLGRDHAEVGNAVSALGSLLMAQGQVSEAERALRFALRLQSKGLGVAHPAVVTTASNLACVLRDTGNLKDAAILFQGVLSEQTKRLGASHPHVGATAGNLAYTLQKAGRPKEALPLARQALEVMQAAFGQQHPSTAAAAANLSSLLRSLGQLSEAYSILQESLDILIRWQGNGHPDTMAARELLAGLEKEMMASKGGGIR